MLYEIDIDGDADTAGAVIVPVEAWSGQRSGAWPNDT
jgi:hypothetical protein